MVPDLHAAAADRDDARLLRFINDIQPLDEPVGWLATFRDAVVALLGDVDRVSLSVNLQSFDREHSVLYGNGPLRRVTPIVRSRRAGDDPAPILLSEAARQGFPVADYHPPIVFTYHAGEGAYHGAIILWRLTTQAGISEHSLELLENLRPFITYRLFDCIARMVRDERIERFVEPLAETIGTRVALTTQQQEIFALVATGMSIGAIATRMGMLPTMVRRQLDAIYKETGAFDVGEIIRRYVDREE